MALPINIEDLIRQRTVDRTRIEYKADWNPEPIIHSITAFYYCQIECRWFQCRSHIYPWSLS